MWPVQKLWHILYVCNMFNSAVNRNCALKVREREGGREAEDPDSVIRWGCLPVLYLIQFPSKSRLIYKHNIKLFITGMLIKGQHASLQNAAAPNHCLHINTVNLTLDI